LVCTSKGTPPRHNLQHLKKMNTNYAAFIAAFAHAACITNLSEADAQWAGWSRSLTDIERSAIEAGGSESGAVEGANFKALTA